MPANVARRSFLRKSLWLLCGLLLLPAAVPAAGLDLAAHRGKVVYLDFWASWCVPCRKSFPWLNELAARYPDDLVIVGINVDHERAAADKFLAKYPASFPLAFDPDGLLAKEYRLQGMPSSVIVDREGRIAERHIGFREEQKPAYESALKKLMGR
ncbi:MAG: TlpA family protein disulfide reductase [Pseudomonadota bacterium]